MKWENYVSASENLLSSLQVPSSLDIITLIKKVNPTRLTLSETDRERGYQLKNRLQSLLLEHYGDTFHLVPHPASPNITLIKHRVLSSIDACHADLAALSSEALEKVETAAPLYPEREKPKASRERGPRQTGAPLSPKEALKRAQGLLEQYDYVAAEEVLAGLQARGNDGLRVLLQTADILLHEIGAYQRCIDTLLSQPKSVLKHRGIREVLAVAYHHNGSLPEARAILDELYPAELGLEALVAYAEIAFKDGNLSAAFQLAQIAEGREGLFPGLESLQKEIESAMSALAEPVAQRARAALQSAAVAEAGELAREALDLYPNCQQARAVVAAIEAQNDEALRAELWARLENEPSGERRIPLLTTLLERDKQKRDTVKMLLAEEKERRRRRIFDEQLESLRRLVLKERWPECFDCVSFLMRQPEFRERACEVLSLSPLFSVLNENKRLHGTSERGTKDLWLRFVKVKLALAAGNDAGCLETFEELKPWFNSCPEFKEDYLALLQREQEKARIEIAPLLEQTEAPECPASEVRQVLGCLRKRMSVLPVEERRELERTMEERLARLVPEQNPGQALEEYREALQIGNSEKVAYLRQEIGDSAAREAIEAEFAEAFHIGWEPLTLEVSDDLPVDLTTAPPLKISNVFGYKAFFKDGDDTYVMIDLAEQAACRLTSPVFAKTTVCDSTEENSFLFVENVGEKLYSERVWRAELSAQRAAFTAHFNVRERCEVEDGFAITGAFISSERDTDYYVLIKDVAGRCPAKVLRKRLAPKATVETLQIGDLKEINMWRWGSYPDRFLVYADGIMQHVNRNLTLKASLRGTRSVYKLDRQNGYLYCLEDGMLTRRNTRLELLRHYERAPCLGMYEKGRLHGISFQTDTVLIVLGDGQQVFYNIGNNQFSSKIRVGRVIPSNEDGKWYCFDYSSKDRKLWLRDITRDIHTELKWREFFFPREKRKKMLKRMIWFNDADNFVHRPEEWGTCESATGDEGRRGTKVAEASQISNDAVK